MEKKNQYMEVAYQLFVDGENGQEMTEEATKERPFQFITGFGVALDAFEQQVAGLQKGDSFDFTITHDQAYGDYRDDLVLDLEREVFSINGHFDHEHVKEGAVIPLHDAEGHYYQAEVLEVGADTVRIDLNYPLAGYDLAFTGTVIENREATLQEMEQMAKMLSGEGCGCGCDHDHCDHDHDHCGCGGCH